MKTKRFLSWILSLAMTTVILSSLSVSAADTITPTKPSTDASGVYQIGTAAELYWFAGLVNGTLTDGTAQNLSANAKLTADITVNSSVLNSDGSVKSGDFIEWTPIGNKTTYYQGNFDGNGKTISGLYLNKYGTDISDYSTNYISFIGHYYNTTGTVKNLTIDDSYFSGSQWVAGIVGNLKNGTIENCVNKATIKVLQRGGGITGGSANSITLKNCRNEGLIYAGTSAAGIANQVQSASKVSNCVNTGNIIWISDLCGGIRLGGLIANVSYGAKSDGSPNSSALVTITNCYNTGNITVARAAKDWDYIGGLVGSLNTAKSVTNCYNTGTVTVTGGINTGKIGSFAGSVYNYKGEYPITIENCFDSNQDTDSLPVYGSNNTNDPEPIVKSSSAFASGEVCYLLNASSSADTVVWKQTLSTDATPNFDGLTVYYDAAKEPQYYNTLLVPEIIGATATDSTLKFISEVSIEGEPEISSFGTTFIPLWLFETGSTDTATVEYDNTNYNISNGQTYGATLTGIPESCKDMEIVGKSFIKNSSGEYTWSAAKYASVNDTTLNSLE